MYTENTERVTLPLTFISSCHVHWFLPLSSSPSRIEDIVLTLYYHECGYFLPVLSFLVVSLTPSFIPDGRTSLRPFNCLFRHHHWSSLCFTQTVSAGLNSCHSIVRVSFHSDFPSESSLTRFGSSFGPRLVHSFSFSCHSNPVVGLFLLPFLTKERKNKRTISEKTGIFSIPVFNWRSNWRVDLTFLLWVLLIQTQVLCLLCILYESSSWTVTTKDWTC